MAHSKHFSMEANCLDNSRRSTKRNRQAQKTPEEQTSLHLSTKPQSRAAIKVSIGSLEPVARHGSLQNIGCGTA